MQAYKAAPVATAYSGLYNFLGMYPKNYFVNYIIFGIRLEEPINKTS